MVERRRQADFFPKLHRVFDTDAQIMQFVVKTKL